MAFQKVALVTGGSAGLGAAVARVLAPDFRVVINYANNQDRAKKVLEELNKIPNKSQSAEQPRFHAIQADVGDKASIQKMVEETISKFGRLDVIVSNAGWTRLTTFANLDEGVIDEDWDKCFTYNVKAHLWLLHAAKSELDKTNGAFITVSSLSGIKPGGSSLPYCVTKSALLHLTKALGVICAPKIRCNSISPGLLLTEWGMNFPEKAREGARENSKLKRLATVEDCADAIRMLALNPAMTGQNLLVEGGAAL